MAQGLLPASALLLLCLCLLLPSSVCAQPPAGAVCSVHVEGSNGSMSKSAVVCSRGSITAASDDPNARQLFQMDSSGVNWTDTLCGLEAKTCLLAICGVSGGGVLELQLNVSGYTDATTYLWGVVCIAGSTQASLKVSEQIPLHAGQWVPRQWRQLASRDTRLLCCPVVDAAGSQLFLGKVAGAVAASISCV